MDGFTGPKPTGHFSVPNGLNMSGGNWRILIGGFLLFPARATTTSQAGPPPTPLMYYGIRPTVRVSGVRESTGLYAALPPPCEPLLRPFFARDGTRCRCCC